MNKSHRASIWLLVFLLSLIITGCSGSGNEVTSPRDVSNDLLPSRTNWGLWQFTADPTEQTLDVAQLRQGNFHANVLPFLEPPANVDLSLESIQFIGDTIDAVIGLTHPFLGQDFFTGFDVCGIVITDGSITGFTDPALRMAGDGETRLLNPDGYTRWWNPTEFPVNDGSIFAYTDGLLGTPESLAGFDATLNGYKYYCDDLVNPDAPLGDVTLAGRGHFSAGGKNVRRFQIKLGANGLVFNYAVDASWAPPVGAPPYIIPDSFPETANKPEAWDVSVNETSNTLWNDGSGNGGELALSIDVHDWFHSDLNTVRVESPGNFPMVEVSSPSGGGSGFSTYEINIPVATPATGSINLLISVISEASGFGGFIPATNTTAYFTHVASVSAIPPVTDNLKNIPLRDDAEARDLAVTPAGELVILYDDGAVWKYLPADDFQQAAATFVFTAKVQPWAYDGQLCDAFIDVGPTGNIFASSATGTGAIGFDWWPCQVFSSTGTPIGGAPAPGTGGPVPDIYIYPTSGTYYNNDMVIAPDTSGMQNNMYRYAGYWAQIYQTAGENADTGYDKVKFLNVVGSEGSSGDQFWLLEDTPDYYAARWKHTGPSWGYFNFDNSWFGTGTQTSDDTGWYEAKDLTMDASNHFYVLDKLPSGQGRIKLFTAGTPGSALTANDAGDIDTISESPLRIEGSLYNSGTYGNLIFVLHGNAIPSKLSVFKPEEFGF